ncbi:MAG: DUF47 family protein [Chloroflexi bacterium]|nr:DUF47 family protein [Chloroflexota bacterium]
MAFSLIPKDVKFAEFFERSIANMCLAAECLAELFANWSQLEQKVQEIKDKEHIGDTITHEIVSTLYKTFITPFDREDINTLTQSIDDVVDHMDKVGQSLKVYNLEKPYPPAKDMANIVLDCCRQLEQIVPSLRSPATLKNTEEYRKEIHRLENQSDTIYRRSLGELFKESDDFKYIIKWREILSHLEEAVNSCEDVAGVIEGIAVKHA